MHLWQKNEYWNNTLHTTQKPSRGLRQALVDLNRFAKELTDGLTDQDNSDTPKRTKRQLNTGLEEDAVIPWIRVAIVGLMFVAAGIVVQLVRQLA